MNPVWKTCRREICLATTPKIMGIVNVTPDSFSDGGKYAAQDAAVAHGLQLIAEGAEILDIGGESTRPYSDPVALPTELQRVTPVFEELARQTDIPLSIDTSKSAVARAALQAGAEIINDVTGFQGDADMVAVARQFHAGVCAMHMQGTPQTMQDHPHYDQVVDDILHYLLQRRDALLAQGIERSRICLDPGIGFGKTHSHNLQLLAEVARFHETGCPILVGHSRKGFIRKFSGDPSRQQRAGTLAVSLHLARAGIQILRVHDVLETRQALRVQQAIEDPRQASEPNY